MTTDTGADRPASPRLYTRALVGLSAHLVTVECHVGQGLPSTTIVGLPEGAVRESRDRVRSALKNSGFDYPNGNVVINLAPGGLSKSSASLDLPIALALLLATGQLKSTLIPKLEFLGELGLFGELRGIQGALACALATSAEGRTLIIPQDNTDEARVAPPGSMLVATHLLQVASALSNQDLEPLRILSPSPPDSAPRQTPPITQTDPFAQVIGQQAAKRALTIAAAGGHHLLMVGPPGTGKTTLARGMIRLMPPLDEQQRLEVAALYSAAGRTREDYDEVPFRDPHHSASAPALIGGGSPPSPGEVALAHHGLLFLDELPHFKPSALDLLREPIESGKAVITRTKYKVTFPCRFQLVAAMNPCPAGRTCQQDSCRCAPGQVQRYLSRISGPMLDRIDIQVAVPTVPNKLLMQMRTLSSQPTLATLKHQVHQARLRQLHRQGVLNTQLTPQGLEPHRQAAEIDETFLATAMTRYQLSARSFHKLWRIARTIADLEECKNICQPHMAQALSYRAMDWEAGAI